MMKKKSLLLAFAASSLNASPQPEPHATPTPCSQKTTHWQLRGDLLYWLPQASGLEVNFGHGSSSQSTTDGVTTTISKETDLDPSFKWNVGYRLALGGRFDDNRWETALIWTDFQGHGSKAANDGRWSVKLNQLDATALYNACLASSFTLQPYFGLRGASIKERLSSRIITHVEIVGSGLATDTRTFRDHQHFEGLGPLFGLGANYAIKWGLGFYGSAAFSVLYGSYHLHFHDTETVTAPATPSQIFSTVDKDTRAFDFNLDLALGVSWEYLIKEACYLTLKLGVENHQYFNQNRLGRNWGNLSFSGGIFSIGLAF